MDEFMMMKYLKEQGMVDKFREFMEEHGMESKRGGFKSSYNRRHYPESLEPFEGWDRHITGKRDFDSDFDRVRMNRGMSDDHFSSSEAQYLVSEMFHTENGRKCIGEKYDIEKAKEVCERYRGFLPSSISPVDVYVAINAQYHDYANLFKSWFGDKIDHKVIESAITFWFKDEDNLGSEKLINYFREK